MSGNDFWTIYSKVHGFITFKYSIVDLSLVKAHTWHVEFKRGHFYIRTKIKQKNHYLHRLILSLNDSTIQGDHIDGDTLNNTRENLRTCSNAQNNQNKQKYKCNKSGFKGVRWCKQSRKWLAQITFNKKQLYLGSFSTKEEAAAAYQEAAKKYHKEFAKY